MKFFLEYRCFDPKISGIWGPFDTRSQAGDFAVALNQQWATWNVVTLKDPNTYAFPKGS